MRIPEVEAIVAPDLLNELPGPGELLVVSGQRRPAIAQLQRGRPAVRARLFPFFVALVLRNGV